ncbi:hypothetical protein C8F04DRAFT_229653 [Mycena alexandri]|uniref:Uncharacterized protein n=1 Tax=Mycena alexandri TaxID=1745969 RepID=A0AAD6SAU0_9AGAR|nr:hypothetical protein C8F04DRAFT_245649 [Mycena alexandri]KAJ7022880.1 hypothetical protein C8F04DRAFT_229653 [Mycena alexandri]
MRTFSLMKAIGLVLLGLVCSINAHDPSHYRSPSNDVHCPADAYVSFVHDSFTFNAPVQKFTNITKSFFDIAWYGGIPASITTGTDNVPGATRFGPLDNGSSFNETLTMYTLDENGLSFTYHGLGFAYALPGYKTADLGAYAETMRFESICAGRGTYIDLITYACSNDSITAYNLWHLEHVLIFPALAAEVGATVMAGDCPEECHNHKT